MRLGLVVHGHFYQPPREDPWTDELPEEPSAAPFREWNSRITAECYRPNGAVPIVGDFGEVSQVVDNYRLLSYNVGPTLLAWLEAGAPDVYDHVTKADRAGSAGGNAIAQAYGHAILPLCNDRDLRTQVRWGLADFRHRFGREPAGMWLPETAVDERTLAVLAEEGVGFTILARYQVEAVDPADPTEAGPAPSTFRWHHPGQPDLGVDLVTYDPTLSHDVAFAGLGGRDLIDRAILAGAPATAADDVPNLVVVACDGETFGHHQRFGELGLAYALGVEAPRRGVEVPGLADWLKSYPPSVAARVSTSSWSCAHGVRRWLDDCGCRTGGDDGWNQRWRAPLRAALDILRDHAAEVFERRVGAVVRDPWQVRDAYVEVLVGAVDSADLFATFDVPPERRHEVRLLLESQRNALLMYTSCGWFFNDLAGIETLQVLRYAARTCDLLDELGEVPPYERFVGVLAEAVSNRPEDGTGADIWHRRLRG